MCPAEMIVVALLEQDIQHIQTRQCSRALISLILSCCRVLALARHQAAIDTYVPKVALILNHALVTQMHHVRTNHSAGALTAARDTAQSSWLSSDSRCTLRDET